MKHWLFTLCLALALVAPSVEPFLRRAEKHSCSCSMQGEACSCCASRAKRDEACKELTCQEPRSSKGAAVSIASEDWALARPKFRLTLSGKTSFERPAPAPRPLEAPPRSIERPPRSLA